MKDGWHTVTGYEVYVEGNKVIRGVHRCRDGYVVAWPYRAVGSATWENVAGVGVEAFRAACRRGNMAML